MTSLPIDGVLPEILGRLRSKPNLVIEAPPGAGKTTRVPGGLISEVPGDVVVLEPRRIAARMAAARVAAERGEPVGQTVGYQIRFEEVASRATRLRFITEGILTRRLMSDPELKRVSAVVLDEFHERHLETDLGIALLRRLQHSLRPDLRIVVMSATLEASPVADFLGSCEVVRSEGRLFPLEVEYTPHSPAPLEQQVASALEGLLLADSTGHILVFLPGAAEIRRCARLCEPIAKRVGMVITPLHGDLSPQEQDRAVLPSRERRLVLSTNVAESSITIDGVTAVIDSGLARIASDDPWTGLPSLDVGRISRASCRQRAGRAGRTGPGRVVRLYTEEDFARRREHDTPEIRRRELSHLLLQLQAMGAGSIDWLDPPPESSWTAAEGLLQRLGAVDGAGAATAVGREMAALPLHPRLSRMVLEAEGRGAGEAGCAAAAVISSGERLTDAPRHHAPSDVLVLAEREWQFGTKRAFDQIRRTFRPRTRCSDDKAILMSILAAFPDRVGRRRQGREYQFAAGMARLAESSAVDADLIVALEVDRRRDQGLPLIRLASAIEADWLIDLFPDRIEERDAVEWKRAAERVEQVSTLSYDGLVFHSSRSGNPDLEEAAVLLAQKAIETGLHRFVDVDALEQLLARSRFAASQGHGAALSMDDVERAVRDAAAGARSFAELERVDVLAAVKAKLPGRIDQVAPERIRLPGGRSVVVHYADGQPPWIASRLQDFFGMRETPRVGGVPVVVHLLAPNQRPVQMTTDLAGFWERLYPQVRRELGRRYPRHKWPENPV